MSATLASSLPAARRADVVGAGQHHDDLRLHAVQLAVGEPPEDVLRRVAAPAEVGRVPAVEVLLPVGEEVGVVGGAPAAGDRVAGEVDVDPPLLRLFEELLVGEHASWRRCAARADRRAPAGGRAGCGRTWRACGDARPASRRDGAQCPQASVVH